jgi:RHH-type proline utilization regulon transcriptional repressor/proline dehydrogenase/delta 1-pyrroline-5-carboxylate dehydrogenase
MPQDDPAAQAVALAGELLTQALHRSPRSERRRLQRLGRMVGDPTATAFTLALTDEVLRIRDRSRSARRLHDLVADYGVPSFPGPLDRAALRAGARLAPLLPTVVMPLVAARLRREGGAVVIPSEDRPLARHIEHRRRQGIRLNINVLGEAILGEDEAGRRVDAVRAQLLRHDVDYVSVKVSSVYSQVNVIAFDHTIEQVAARLRPLYETARRCTPPKFVNLDMEEYRDLHLTAAVLERVLDEPAFADLDAGIVLQAYLPDSLTVLEDLAAWDAARTGELKVRIVKGANLAMERVDAELHGWEQAPFATKAEVDANFKRLVRRGVELGVRLGVASHNLFDVAWALGLRERTGGRIELEMLEGMAEGQALAVAARAGGLLLYAPVAAVGDVESSIAYLARRLDENTAPDNYLRQVFSLRPGSPEFFGESRRFLTAVSRSADPAAPPRRAQDRRRPVVPFEADKPFANEADTDFSLAANRAWLAVALAAPLPTEVPAVVGGAEVRGSSSATGTDPSHPDGVLYRYTLADAALVDRAVEVARSAGPRWAGLGAAERRGVLAGVATAMARGRDEAVAAMIRDAGKTVAEADPEVSEAIDFTRLYATSTKVVFQDVTVEPLGTVVVAPPWNFPYSIPAGGVTAALAAGNAVILKPAPETVLTAWVLAKHCWAGGVPRDVLQFLPCPDDEVGRRLITHPDVDAVVLTGAWETAQLFLGWKPSLRLHAETSGKNAIVVTAAADLDAAVRDLVRSAFGSAGQKCSAASLAIVEGGVLDEGSFLRRLADATRSLRVGPASDLATTVGPLIRPPGPALERALTTLEPGEEWLVEPAMVAGSRYLWSPGVKTGVRRGSWFHRTECFGPVLGVIRVGDLDEAVAVQNDTDFGLTGGLHSLDRREIDRWIDGVEVGNAYVNRHITGAIAGRQPFGGWKRSSVGSGAKTGGANQVLSLQQVKPAVEHLLPDVVTRSFTRWQHEEFEAVRDPAGLKAEANVVRYRRLPGWVILRAGRSVPDRDLSAALLAASLAGVEVELSSDRTRPALGRAAVVEDEAALAARLPASGAMRLRVLGPVGDDLLGAAVTAGLEVDDHPAVPNGRVELLRWHREQAVTITMHRYGNPIDRHGPEAPSIVRVRG